VENPEMTRLFRHGGDLRTQHVAILVGVLALAAAGMNPGSSSAVTAAATTNGAVPVVPVAATPALAAPAAVHTPTPAELRKTQVDGALQALESSVVKESHEGAVRTAFQAYFNYKAAHPEDVKNPYLYFVDYGLDNRTPRGYVFDMENLTLVDGPFLVAHGRGSSKSKNSVPTRFSNRPGAATTSLGLYVTQETYGFSGHTGGRLYTSVGLRLQGVSGEFNSAARARGVVVHGAPYVTASGSGRSEGCPAMEQSRARKLIPMIANGGLVFLYSPNDAQWLDQDRWATAES
jgi:hypothetical protein